MSKYEIYNGGLVPVPKDAGKEWYRGLLKALGIKDDIIKLVMKEDK